MTSSGQNAQRRLTLGDNGLQPDVPCLVMLNMYFEAFPHERQAPPLEAYLRMVAAFLSGDGIRSRADVTDLNALEASAFGHACLDYGADDRAAIAEYLLRAPAPQAATAVS